MTAARYLCLAVPLALTLAGIAADRRGGRGGALLAFVAAFVGIAGLHEVAQLAGWYAFSPVTGAYRGLPVDLWLGWAALWGPVPLLLRRWLPLPVALGLLLWLDVVAMSRLDTLGGVVTLGPQWLVGELVGLVAVALPAQLLGRWTAQRRHLRARVVLQLAVFTGLSLWLVPSVAFTLGDGSWAALTGLPAPRLFLLAQLALLLAVPALAAVQEFARRGQGTAYPWDPPRRLVTTGPYAYLANPMQVSAVALLLLLAAVTGSGALAAAAIAAAAFAAGVAGPHEREDLRHRYGRRWYAYRRHVRAWWPRWRPYRQPDPAPDAAGTARLWLDAGCPACRATGRFLQHRNPSRLWIVPAHRQVRVPWRAEYEDRDGTTESGVAAVARGLEHLSLGWAYLGWLLRLPVIRPVAQVVTDALIVPPHPARAPATGGDACPTQRPTQHPRQRPGPGLTPSGGCATGRSSRSSGTASPASPRVPSPPPPG